MPIQSRPGCPSTPANNDSPAFTQGLPGKSPSSTQFRSLALSALLVLLALYGSPASASELLIHCALEGRGHYVYEPETNIDWFRWRGELSRCATPEGAVSPEQGNFEGHGFVDGNAALTGAGELTLRWSDGQTSQLSFAMAGLPALLVMSGTVSSGLYEGYALTMEFHCKLQDTLKCFQLGSSSWEFFGKLDLSGGPAQAPGAAPR